MRIGHKGYLRPLYQTTVRFAWLLARTLKQGRKCKVRPGLLHDMCRILYCAEQPCVGISSILTFGVAKENCVC